MVSIDRRGRFRGSERSRSQSDEPLEDGEIPENPPLPNYPPPPSPSFHGDIDDPNFVPPLPTSPPPSPKRYRRYQEGRSWRDDRSDYSSRHTPVSQDRRNRYSNYRQSSRERTIDPRQPRSQQQPSRRRYDEQDWQPRYPQEGRFRNDANERHLYDDPNPHPPNRGPRGAPPMHCLPSAPMEHPSYPYPSQPWPNSKPPHRSRISFLVLLKSFRFRCLFDVESTTLVKSIDYGFLSRMLSPCKSI